jgi:hypothetical protein
MNTKSIIGKYLVVIILGLLIFGIDSIENLSNRITILCVVGICLFKSFYFIHFLFKQIIEASKRDTLYYRFLVFMAINVALIILSFSIDYFCLSEIEHNSFSGVAWHISTAERFFDFLYFSILAFTNFGYDQIAPSNIAAKIIISTELLISFATIIFILSDFISLKDSLQNRDK